MDAPRSRIAQRARTGRRRRLCSAGGVACARNGAGGSGRVLRGAAAAAGLEYGPAFRGLVELRRGQPAAEAFGRVVLQEGASTAAVRRPPGASG